MYRKSFLSGSKIQKISKDSLWHLPGVASHKIGFGICPDTGLIIQSPSPSPNVISKYYKEVATYTNPGNNGKPTDTKIKDVNRLINFVYDSVGYISKKIFQVGSSDGYTLSQFMKQGSDVFGIDPSIASNELASNLYGVKTVTGDFENYDGSQKKYGLIILTHVLEHLFDPVSVMKKCNKMQNIGDFVLIEVPLFERIERFGPGLLTLEHINYFSEGTLIETLTSANYYPECISKSFNHPEYPVITVMARKDENVKVIKSLDFEKNYTIFGKYIKNEELRWQKLEKKILSQLPENKSIYIYGAGIHTTQLLANTKINSYCDIIGLFDSSSTKWGKKIGEFECFNIDDVSLGVDDSILISSFAYEEEIYDFLTKNFNNNIVRIYG